MKLSSLMVIAGVLALAFGLAFLLVPGPLASLYGVTLDSAGILIARFYGSGLIHIGLLALLARNITHAQAQQPIVLAYFIGLAIGFIVALLGQLSGLLNPLGWSTVAIYLFLALGYGYFQFIKPSAS